MLNATHIKSVIYVIWKIKRGSIYNQTKSIFFKKTPSTFNGKLCIYSQRLILQFIDLLQLMFANTERCLLVARQSTCISLC